MFVVVSDLNLHGSSGVEIIYYLLTLGYKLIIFSHCYWGSVVNAFAQRRFPDHICAARQCLCLEEYCQALFFLKFPSWSSLFFWWLCFLKQSLLYSSWMWYVFVKIPQADFIQGSFYLTVNLWFHWSSSLPFQAVFPCGLNPLKLLRTWNMLLRRGSASWFLVGEWMVH